MTFENIAFVTASGTSNFKDSLAAFAQTMKDIGAKEYFPGLKADVAIVISKQCRCCTVDVDALTTAMAELRGSGFVGPIVYFYAGGCSYEFMDVGGGGTCKQELAMQRKFVCMRAISLASHGCDKKLNLFKEEVSAVLRHLEIGDIRLAVSDRKGRTGLLFIRGGTDDEYAPMGTAWAPVAQRKEIEQIVETYEQQEEQLQLRQDQETEELKQRQRKEWDDLQHSRKTALNPFIVYPT